MRVGLVSRHLGLPVGFGTYAEHLIRALRERGDGNEYVVYAPRAVPNVRAALTAWELAGAPARAARDRLDVLHYLHPAYPALRPRTPTVVSVLDAITRVLPGYRLPAPYDRLEARAARAADRVVTISRSARDDIAACFGVPSERIDVTYLGAPPVDPEPSQKEDYWLFVGGTERRKNLATALAAFARGPFERHRLKVVGPTAPSPIADSRESLMAGVDERVAERVDWLGRVPAGELADLYRRALALVFPSRYEGFGLPVLEAMARHTPVIAAAVSSIPEVARDAAELVSPDDPAALAEAMARVAADEAHRRRMVARGLEVVAGFTWEQTARRTVAVYEDLAGRTTFA